MFIHIDSSKINIFFGKNSLLYIALDAMNEKIVKILIDYARENNIEFIKDLKRLIAPQYNMLKKYIISDKDRLKFDIIQGKTHEIIKVVESDDFKEKKKNMENYYKDAENKNKEGCCIICFEEVKKKVVLDNCGHSFSICKDHHSSLTSKEVNKCPFCRSNFDKVIDIYCV